MPASGVLTNASTPGIRARLALMHCGAQCELREVALKDKPTQMLEISNKGTVPVLVLPTILNQATEPVANSKSTIKSYRVIDESIDIMRWAMNENPARQIPNANTQSIRRRTT